MELRDAGVMHLLELQALIEEQVIEIFELAKKLKANQSTKLLSGKTFILFFPETSLRTRLTFEKGIKDLGGECILFPPQTLDTRESPVDVMNYLSNWADALIVRHPNQSMLSELATYGTIPVINAMTDRNHPCEILSDLFSLSELRENFSELVYTYVGPVSNILRTWTEAARVMNLQFNHVCTFENELTQNIKNYRFSTHLEETLVGSDVVLTDSLPSEYLNSEYLSSYQITLDRMKKANPGALFNPCPPFYWNEEASDEVIHSPYFVGYAFKKNLIYVQQAILIYCLGLKLNSDNREDLK